MSGVELACSVRSGFVKCDACDPLLIWGFLALKCLSDEARGWEEGHGVCLWGGGVRVGGGVRGRWGRVRIRASSLSSCCDSSGSGTLFC